MRLVLVEGTDLAAEARDTMQTTVREVFAPLRVTVDWIEPFRVLAPAPLAADSYLKVILHSQEPATWRLPPNTMGAVLSPGSPARAVHVFEPVIRRLLLGRSRRRGFVSARRMGRALGKVAAHEVVHALTPEPCHSHRGLMTPSQHRNSLAAPKTDLDPASVAALRQGVSRMRQPPPGEAPTP